MKKTRGKILLLGLTGNVGGVETFICNILQYINSDSLQIDCLTHQEVDPCISEIITSNNGSIYHVTGIKQNFLVSLSEIIDFYREHNDYDVVHANVCDASYLMYYFPILFDKNKALIIHSHNSSSDKAVFHYSFRLIQNCRVSVKLACSDVAARWMFGKGCKNYRIIKNGIDLEKYRYDKDRANKIRIELGVSQKYVIGSIARFTEQKNHIRILSIFEKYLEANKDAVLILVGNGEKIDNIKALVKKKGLGDKAIFLGIRDDVDQLLMAFDLFLMPSLYEGLPFVAIEAQASGLPMLVSDTVSPEMRLTSLITSKCLDDGDAEWAQEIDSIRHKCVDRDSLNYGNSIRDSGYDVRETMRELAAIYDDLIDYD